jgi:hypothetical protein
VQFAEFLERIEATILAQFQASGFVEHSGDKGENREDILRDFLSKHLPPRYGVTKGEILTSEGDRSHSADVIIYDAVNCPVLYAERTAILPVEGVYGIIEVKSALSKAELINALSKIKQFKELAPRNLSLIETREYMTFLRPSRPFGIVLGFRHADNSLASLERNWVEFNQEAHYVNTFANLIVVLGSGLIHFERVDLSLGEKHLLFGTDELVNLVELVQKRARNNEPSPEILLLREVIEDLGPRTFGRFFVYLLIMLERMKLSVPDLGRYLDPALPFLIHRES